MPKLLTDDQKNTVRSMHAAGHTEAETIKITNVSRGSYHQLTRKKAGRPKKTKIGRARILNGAGMLGKAKRALKKLRQSTQGRWSPTWEDIHKKMPPEIREAIKPRALANNMRGHGYKSRPRRKRAKLTKKHAEKRKEWCEKFRKRRPGEWLARVDCWIDQHSEVLVTSEASADIKQNMTGNGSVIRLKSEGLDTDCTQQKHGCPVNLGKRVQLLTVVASTGKCTAFPFELKQKQFCHLDWLDLIPRLYAWLGEVFPSRKGRFTLGLDQGGQFTKPTTYAEAMKKFRYFQLCTKGCEFNPCDFYLHGPMTKHLTKFMPFEVGAKGRAKLLKEVARFCTSASGEAAKNAIRGITGRAERCYGRDGWHFED